MTEAEWLTCSEATAMVEVLKANVSERKRQLFAVACCRRFWSKISDPRGQRAVEVAERFADGLANQSERDAAIQAASAALQEYQESEWGDPDASEGPGGTWNVPYYEALHATVVICKSVELATINHVYRDTTSRPGRRFKGKIDWKPNTEHIPEEGMDTSDLIRELFGNPFRPVPFDARWRTGDSVGLARTIYEDRAFDRLPLLADALMDAGCADEQVLGHCRSNGPHVRGCWVVDLVIGKE
jgi:hypothetical protein